MKKYFEVVKGTSHCLLISDEESGLRICGSKQWGGGEIVHKWEITEDVARDIVNCLKDDFPNVFKKETKVKNLTEE